MSFRAESDSSGIRRRESIYLDWNATTPPHPTVLEAMLEAARTAWANPASVHGMGRLARVHVEHAREAIASVTGFDARDVILTSGGTEANNLALWHAFGGIEGPQPGHKPQALVVSRIEHPSVVHTAERLAARGVIVEWAGPDPSGVVPPAAIEDALQRASVAADVKLVSLQAVNHETGVIQPIGPVAELAHARGIPLHVDAVQALGKLGPQAWAGADLLSVAAHKIRGPKGIGALVTRPGIRLWPVLQGGAQERGIRPGTQDPAACAGFAVASERARDTPQRYAAAAPLRDRLETELTRIGKALGAPPIRNGNAPRAPHVLNFSWPGWRGDELAAALDLEGVSVSSGSACSAGTAEPSPVLLAMLGEERASSAVRVSLGDNTTLDDILEVISRWDHVLRRGDPKGQS